MLKTEQAPRLFKKASLFQKWPNRSLQIIVFKILGERKANEKQFHSGI